MCYGYQTCTECREDPACGWCDDGTGTGVGACRVGGASGPLEKMAQREISSSHVQWIAADTCSSSQQKSWHFTSCPGSNILTLFCAIFHEEGTLNCHILGHFKRQWSGECSIFNRLGQAKKWRLRTARHHRLSN